MQKVFLVGKLFLWFAAIASFFISYLFNCYQSSCNQGLCCKLCFRILEDDFGVKISKEKVEVNILGDVIIHGLRIKDDRNNDLILPSNLEQILTGYQS